MNAREHPSNLDLPSPPDRSASATSSSARNGLSGWWLLPLGLVLLVLALSVRRESSDTGLESPSIGKPAPQFDLVSLSEDLSLPSYQWQPGRVTLLHFWGTWCGPCRMEYPHLSEMAGRFGGDERFDFIPVTCENSPGETFEGLWTKTHEYLQSNRIDSPAYADPRGVTRRSAAERLQRDSLFYPTSVLIDHQGKIAGVWEGYTPDSVDQIRVLTDRLIADHRD